MSDIKTMTEEINELSINIKEIIYNGEAEETAKALEKIIEKLDEIINKLNS